MGFELGKRKMLNTMNGLVNFRLALMKIPTMKNFYGCQNQALFLFLFLRCMQLLLIDV